jgi:hypothetical protein
MTREQYDYLAQYVSGYTGTKVVSINFEIDGSMILVTEHPSSWDFSYQYKDRVYIDGSMQELDTNEVAV